MLKVNAAVFKRCFWRIQKEPLQESLCLKRTLGTALGPQYKS